MTSKDCQRRCDSLHSEDEDEHGTGGNTDTRGHVRLVRWNRRGELRHESIIPT